MNMRDVPNCIGYHIIILALLPDEILVLFSDSEVLQGKSLYEVG